MDRRTGIWVDHERAVIVTLASFGTTIEREQSGAGKRVRLAGGSRSRTPYGPQDASDEPSREARYRNKLRRYYDRVAALAQNSAEIYICGPGEAKLELKKAMQKRPEMGRRIIQVQPADKMTDKQFVAHVRSYFGQPRRITARA